VSISPVEFDDFPETGLIDEPLFLALPEELFVLLGERAHTRLKR